MAAQPITEALQPFNSETYIRVAHEPLDEKQAENAKSNMRKQLELKISYSVKLSSIKSLKSPTQYTVMPPRYMTGAKICGILQFNPKRAGILCEYEYDVTFEATQAKLDPSFDHCEMSLDVDPEKGSLSGSPKTSSALGDTFGNWSLTIWIKGGCAWSSITQARSLRARSTRPMHQHRSIQK